MASFDNYILSEQQKKKFSLESQLPLLPCWISWAAGSSSTGTIVIKKKKKKKIKLSWTI